MRILTQKQVQEVDHKVLKSGLILTDLILEVGEALAQWFVKHSQPKQKILFLVGPGNNGNDALALALTLKKKAYKNLKVHLLGRTVGDETIAPWLAELKEFLVDKVTDDCDFIVDGLFGIGLSQKPTGAFAHAITEANKANAKRVSIDIPSGVMCDSGIAFQPSFQAHHTLTVSCAKPGLFLLPGAELAGEVSLIPVASLQQAVDDIDVLVQPIGDAGESLDKLKPGKTSNKYTRGPLAIVLCETYPGAALMAAQSAQTVGGGYITLYCPDSLLKTCQVEHPEFVFKPYTSTEDLAHQLVADKWRAVVMGPGWDLQSFPVESVLQKESAFVFDGGILSPDLLTTLQESNNERWILTPHGGELKKMLGKDIHKWDLAVEWSQPGVIIAKGYDTLIARSDEPIKLATWNAPSLAVAGSGDILAGLIGAFLAHGLEPMEAAQLAVDLHRKAGARYPVSATPPQLIQALSDIINS